MKKAKKDVAESIRHRLRNRAKTNGEDISFSLPRYAMERFLFRLGESPYRERFILKGASLYPIWGSTVYRPTRDLDFTDFGSSGSPDLIEVVEDLCRMSFDDDGLHFDPETISVEPIRDEAEYHGSRIHFVAMLGKSRIPLQIDIGFGNAVEPAPIEIEYPSMLDHRAPRIRAYPMEAVIAEKFHAMVVLGEQNSRLKDFYDLVVFVRQFSFKGEDLGRAIAATFKRRGTVIESGIPAGLAPRFFADNDRAERWLAYLKRVSWSGMPIDFISVGELLRGFFIPLWQALGNRLSFSGSWPPSGPWRY